MLIKLQIDQGVVVDFDQKPEQFIVRSDDRLFEADELFSGKFDKYLKHSWEYALLCAYVYESSVADELVPEQKLEIENSGWSLLPDIDELFKDNKKRFLKGLKLQTFYRKIDGVVHVAYVFRGTRFTKLNDWAANFHWLYKWIPFVRKDYYKQVKEDFDQHVQNVEKYFSGEIVKHITGGHSLGGGLAQKAAYISKNVKLSYVFDSSPVTGYFSVKKEDRLDSCTDLRIYRFYEHGEILAYLRAITQIGYALNFKPNKNPFVAEIRTNLVKGTPIKQHSIDIFRAIKDMTANLSQTKKLNSLKKISKELKREAKRSSP